MIAQQRLVLGRPAMTVALLHQYRHQPPGLLHLVDQALLFTLCQVTYGMIRLLDAYAQVLKRWHAAMRTGQETA